MIQAVEIRGPARAAPRGTEEEESDDESQYNRGGRDWRSRRAGRVSERQVRSHAEVACVELDVARQEPRRALLQVDGVEVAADCE